MAEENGLPVPDEYFLLWVLTAQTKDAILKARERDYARFDISNERRAVLFLVQRLGGRSTPAEIARGLFRELHSITELLKRMEADGLIIRQKGSGKSKVEVTLTEKGTDVLNQSLLNETDKRIFSCLTKSERQRLAALLWKVRSRALEDLGVPEWHFKFPLNPYLEENGGERPAVRG